jgi:subtilisin family serine protease
VSLRAVIRGALRTGLLVGAWAAGARAQERPLGPTVRALAALGPADRLRLAADTARARRAAVTRDPDGVLVAHLLVRLRTPDAGPLLRFGARLGTRAGTLVSARVPIESLDALLAAGDIAAVYGVRRWAPLNDIATADIGVAGLRRFVAPDDFTGPVGRGVIVGLVDTGVDFTHGDFQVDSLQRSRILYLWDQTLAGAGPGLVGGSTFSYGVECRQEDLTPTGCPSRDVIGHGTHVAGTAAGDGSATGGGFPAGRFAGVAPGADLIVVETTFLSDAVVDGVNYIFSRAQQLGRPAVVNLSLGSQWGPHDGTLPEEEALDSLEGPGRIVVAAAGNSGDNRNTTPPVSSDRVHGALTLSAAGQTDSFSVFVPANGTLPGPSNDYLVLQLWYAATDTVTVTIVRPDGSFASASATGGPGSTVTQDAAQGRIHIENGPGTGVALSADNLAYIVLGDLGGGTEPRTGIWTIRVTSVAAHSGRPMHLWAADGALGPPGSIAGVTLVGNATNGYAVTSPATATRVLAVGAYGTRLSWQDVTGGAQRYSVQERLGDLAAFSSSGPRRDGVLKPDLAAPGKGIASALSRDAGVPSGRVLADGRHWILEGTSMAAPFVTGSVALLLERNPALTPEAARALLSAAARVDSFSLHPFDGGPGGTPNASWGRGKLAVPAALGALVQLAALKAGQANDAIAGRLAPSGEFRILHLLVIGDPDSSTVLDSLALTAAGSVNEGATLAYLKAYRDPAKQGAIPAPAVPVATAALAGNDPRVVLPLGGMQLAPRDTVSLVLTTQLAGGVVTPTGGTVRFDVATAGDVFLHWRSNPSRPVAVQGIPYRGPLVTLQAPGQLAIGALQLGSGGGSQPSARFSRFTVLRVQLAASVDEPIAVQQLGLKVAGSDPAAALRVVLDANGDGVAETSEAILADTTVSLSADSVFLPVTPANLVVPPGTSLQILLDVRTSGSAPNGARFGAAIAPAAVHTRDLYSGLADHFTLQAAMSSGTVTTTLLGPGEPFNISENPVRASSVIFNYAVTPRRIAVHSFTGGRIREFSSPPDGSLTWDLTTDGGRPVVNGVYIVVLDFGDSVIRRRLYVARRAGP